MGKGATLDIEDSLGRTAFSYAIIKNKTKLVQSFLSDKSRLKLDRDQTDMEGRSAVHLVVQPTKAASFENV